MDTKGWGRSVRFVVHVRTVKTSSGATAVQIVHSNHFGKRDIEHIGSAHSDAEIDVLKAVARQRMSAGQAELDLGLAPVGAAGQPAVVTSSRMARLWGAISQAFAALGLEAASGGAFRVLGFHGEGFDRRLAPIDRLAY